MTDAEHAAVLRRLSSGLKLDPFEWAAIERAIELLEREADQQDATRLNRVEAGDLYA